VTFLSFFIGQCGIDLILCDYISLQHWLDPASNWLYE